MKNEWKKRIILYFQNVARRAANRPSLKSTYQLKMPEAVKNLKKK